jgi:hypothetical protein
LNSPPAGAADPARVFVLDLRAVVVLDFVPAAALDLAI